MERLEKLKSLGAVRADAEADIALINQFTRRPMKPEEVYCFSVNLCDNDVDRDMERFTDGCLQKLASMFVGKTGLQDHRWSSEKQFARLYRAEVVDGKGKNALGEPLRVLRGCAYVPNTESNRPLIEAIDGGIAKEVSVGVGVSKCTCSICGKPQKLDYRTWTYQCETGHIKGETYDGRLCVGNLEDPKEAYEFSLVAVPAQRSAGITKGVQNLDDAFDALMTADLSGKESKIKDLMPRMQSAMLADTERAERAKIIQEAQKYQ